MLSVDERPIAEDRTVHARVVMDPMTNEQEWFDDWRDEINALLIPELVHNRVRQPCGRWEWQTYWILPEHELRLDVTAPFVPTDLKGILWQGDQAIHWNAIIDLDASYEVASSTRKHVVVYAVVEDK